MKYNITYSCGHTGTVDLIGKGADRERKINYFEQRGLCPDCYKAQMRKTESQQPLIYNISVLPALTTDGEIVAYGYFSGNTMPVKDSIKAIGGYHWEDCKSAEYQLSVSVPKCWGKIFTESSLAEEINKAKALGAQIKGIKNNDSALNISSLIGYGIAVKMKAEYNAKQDKLSALSKPERPAILKDKKWNGKIYRNAIYLDGEKVSITKEDEEALNNYSAAMDEYRAAKKKIMEGK